MPRLLAILIMALSALAAVEPGIEDAVEDLHQEALEHHDLWTCLQLEAYAGRHGLRLPASLGRGGRVIGDPLLSYPAPIVGVVDRGDHQVVVAGSRYYPVAFDGRPLARSQPLPFTPDRIAASADGRYLATATLTGPVGSQVLRLAVQDLHHDVRRWQRADPRPAIPARARETLTGSALSADGSAVGVTVRRTGVRPQVRTLVVGTERTSTAFADFTTIQDLGPEGRWMLAVGEEGRGCYVDGALVQANSLGGRAATGAGAAMLLDSKRQCQLVAADGTIAPWQPAELAGPVLELTTVDQWLVVTHLPPASDGAAPIASSESVDLFASPPAPEDDSADLFASAQPATDAVAAAPGPVRPQAIALYPWRDLVGQPGVAPVHRFPGRAGLATSHGRALWLSHGTELALLDLNRASPHHQVLATLPAAAMSLWPSRSASIALLVDGSAAIFDHRGRVLFHLADAAPLKLQVLSGRAALAWPKADFSAQRLLVLDPEPAARRDCLLAEWPAPFRQHHAQASDDAASLAVGSPVAWLSYDTTTGAVVERHAGPERRPLPVRPAPGHPLGRMLLSPQRSHLLPIGDPAAGSTTPWTPSDAVLSSRAVAVLDTDGVLRVEGRTGWEELGRQAGLLHFVDVPGDNGIFLGADQRQALVQLVPNRGLVALAEPRRTQPRSHGSWQVDGLRYSAPGNARTLSWDGERFGFTPLRLQGQDRSALLAFLPGVVLQLDPRTASALGVDDATRAARRAKQDAQGTRATRR